MTETWLPIAGFGDKYSVSADGQVYNHWLGRLIAQRLDTDGYRIVDLWGPLGQKTSKVHRLVLEAYVGPAPKGKGLGDHRNGERADNRISNLRWVSESVNLVNRHKCLGASGSVGVRYRTDKQKWQAYGKFKGRFKSLGHYENKDAAVAARQRHVEEICNG
jgi:hypothetical protein